MSYLSLLISLSPSASAFCGTFVGDAGTELYNHASQVALVREGDRTTLTLGIDYDGPLDDFALVIPVPVVLGSDDVRTTDAGLLARLAQYSGPRLVAYTCADFQYYYGDYGDDMGGGPRGCSLGCRDYSIEAATAMEADAAGGDTGQIADDTVTVEAAFTEGAYEIVVLSAEESRGLYIWLDQNGYSLPAGGEAILDEYIDAGAYFFAARVHVEGPSGGDRAPMGLAPLQFSYESAVFSLPVRIGTISSPGEQDLLIYTLTSGSDGQVGISNYPEVLVEDECMWEDGGEGFTGFYDAQFADAQASASRPGWVTEYTWSQNYHCDPCTGEPPDADDLSELGFTGDGWDSHFTRLHLRYRPEQVDQDLVLYTSGVAATDQIRYIAYDEQLEDMFPVCGVGWVENPGTCDEEEEADASVDEEGRNCGAPVVPLAGLMAAGAALVLRRRRR